jgi:DNA-binding transcriptional MerR regulator
MSGAAGVGHLSIGEVLSLVQADFPDVTISKIRFLESQGLIAPERTAAGYRKFYDSDIERLRWILRQQRDHFLPLKVIRKMLDQGVDVSPEAQPTLWSSAASGPAGDAVEDQEHSQDGEATPSSTREDRSEAAEGPDQSSEQTAEQADAEPVEESQPTIDVRDPSPDQLAEDEERARYRSPAHPAVASAHTRGRPSRSRREEASAEAGRPTYTTPADVVAALQEEPRTRRRSTPPARQEPAEAQAQPPTPPGPPPGSGDDPELRLSRAELCETAGIDAELLTDLEQFGLIEPTVLGGDAQYDSAALSVARIAARYAELGVGARHLRMYKVSAEREAGFVEQLVVPYLKQRNPAARTEAEQRSEELQRMGAELHATLLRRRLGPTFGS